MHILWNNLTSAYRLNMCITTKPRQSYHLCQYTQHEMSIRIGQEKSRVRSKVDEGHLSLSKSLEKYIKNLETAQRRHLKSQTWNRNNFPSNSNIRQYSQGLISLLFLGIIVFPIAVSLQKN